MTKETDSKIIIDADRAATKQLKEILPSISDAFSIMYVASLIAALEVSADTIERLQKELDFRREVDAASAGDAE